MMERLIIVSNRLPTSIVKRDNTLHFQQSIGGLATGLDAFAKSKQSLWIGWPGIPTESIRGNENDIRAKLLSNSCHPVFLPHRYVEDYYHGFCNKTIWPLFHYFNQYVTYDKDLWESYRDANQKFCDVVVEVAKPRDTIWIHDYHLMLLPKIIREKSPDATIGFFLHIPFPSFEVFRMLPWRREILDGLLGADLIGFHTYDYVKNFLDSVRRILGHEHVLGQVYAGNRVVKADVFPMGVDYDRFSTAINSPKVQTETKKITDKTGERKVILSVDRLDYTKGITQRLEAFSLFLERYPEYHEKVVFILVAVPSRTSVEHYRLLKKETDELVGRINGRHGTLGWVPVWYLHRFLPFNNLIALYNIAHVALLTPLRDGMNLISKEFVATKASGKAVLILSEMAGAERDLGEAIIVNPNDKWEVAEAIREALEMSEEEQIERNRPMQKRLQRYNIVRWANDFMEGLSEIKKVQQEYHSKNISRRTQEDLFNRYSKSKKRLILLDYDGTLISFADKPERAKPDRELLTLLGGLSSEAKNEVVIVSGRDRGSLGRWFSDLRIGLIAEHGVWIKEKDGDWRTIESLRNEWKEEIRSFLELYADRTPGSFVEEKEFSLVWHYRKADPELAALRTRELRDAVIHLTANLSLQVLEGNKVIEIKNAGIDKGKAALNWISKGGWDFVLAIGDDQTDEDIFAIVPDSAYSIKVGYEPSRAKFNIDSPKEVRRLIRDLEKNHAKRY